MCIYVDSCKDFLIKDSRRRQGLWLSGLATQAVSTISLSPRARPLHIPFGYQEIFFFSFLFFLEIFWDSVSSS